MTGEIQRLRAEIRSDRRAFEQRAAELAALVMKTDGSALASSLAQTAVVLHHAYAVDLHALRLQSRRAETATLGRPALLANLDQLGAFLETLAHHPSEE